MDPITLELIQTRLTSVVREMRTVVIRTAYSPMIHEGHDFSCAILDPCGELVAASEVDQPTHLCALPWCGRSVIDAYRDDIGPGDLFLHNDPYTGGTHLNDIALFFPVFRDQRLFAFAAVMAHWQDVGGMVPGSLSGTATEIFQEGVRIPGIRAARRGVPHHEALALLFANVRQPDARRGDLRAMEGACRVAERRLHQLLDRWGEQITGAALGSLLDRAEARMRAAIAQVPDGTHAYETWLDNTGDQPRPLRLCLQLTVAGESIHADFNGCAPQVDGPTNLGPAHATTAVFTMCKALLDPTGPVNAGAMRPLTVDTPLGTVVNARPPAACGAIGEVRRALESLVVGTLGKAVPARLVGDLKGASNLTSIGGARPDGGGFLFVEFPAGGTGGWRGGDGNNAVRNFAEGDISSIQPVEAVELTSPIRIDRMSLRCDSGGAGQRRGGLGLEREVRLLAPQARLSVLSDHNVIPPYGVRGGHASAPNGFTVRRDGAEIAPSALPGKVTGWPMHAHDVLIMRTAGGGGYGSPLARDPLQVARDLATGYVSARAARVLYGVVLRRGAVDTAATEAMRARLAAQRMVLRAGIGPADEDPATRRLAVLSRATARTLGLRDGALVEFPCDDGPSLRAWIRIHDTAASGECLLDAAGLAMLGTAPGGSLELRPLEHRRARALRRQTRTSA